MEYYPTVSFLSTSVTNARIADTASGDNLALAGLNANSQNVLTLYNTANHTETQLIRPDNEIEIYHLHYVASSNRLMFDGLRFADNKYVIGEVDLGTHQVTVFNTSSAKWGDVQPFN
jgi:hypothetical protein